MKRFLALLLSAVILLTCNIIFFETHSKDSYVISKEDAQQFADELKEMSTDAYDVSNRLIVSSNKDIDYMDAIDIATGIEGLYVLQFPDNNSASEAYAYYNSLSYVNYVEYDCVEENALCETEYDFDFVPQCYSTVNCNIDDAIKLLYKEYNELPEIKIGVIDSGIAVTAFTESRFDGGYSFLEGYSEDGTEDLDGHGTQVAGTIILNTSDNIRLYSYQITDKNGSGTVSNALSAIYLATSEECDVINCSFGFNTAANDRYSIIDAVDYATENGTIVVCAAGNDSGDLNILNHYPAKAPSAITVGGVSRGNILTSTSNYGSLVDIYAPGTGMTTYDKNGSLVQTWSGTSAASPVIASIVSLMLCVNPDLTVDEIKELLLETGNATNEDNQSKTNRVVADAYEIIKVLTGEELEQVQLDYDMSWNPETIYTDISFTTDCDSTIYYYFGLGGYLYTPFKENDTVSQMYKYENGTTVNLSRWGVITVCAYAPGKAKSKIEYIMAPINYYDSGFLLNAANATQEYNIISRCQLKDTVIEVPNEINGYEVQEIGKYCFMGNKDVETIILPESVKKIDEYAFANCPNLKTVIAPGVTRCMRYAFYDCESLVNVEMPDLTYANTGLFKNCTSLETAKLGALTEIDNHAFYGCENLILVKTTDDDISFAVNTFKDCDLLTLYTPNSSTAIYKYAKSNDIPVIISFNYQLSGVGSGTLSYTDKELNDTVIYKAENVRRMWGTDCINQKPSFDELGFLFELNDDGIINAKDYAQLVRYAG